MAATGEEAGAMIGHCDARAALTGHCDVKAALFGRRGGETHASSAAAAWSYGTDRNGTSASARGKQRATVKESGGEIKEDKARKTQRGTERVLREGEGGGAK